MLQKCEKSKLDDENQEVLFKGGPKMHPSNPQILIKFGTVMHTVCTDLFGYDILKTIIYYLPSNIANIITNKTGFSFC